MRRAIIRLSAENVSSLFIEGHYPHRIRLPADAKFIGAHSPPGAAWVDLYFDSESFANYPEGGAFPILSLEFELEICTDTK